MVRVAVRQRAQCSIGRRAVRSPSMGSSQRFMARPDTQYVCPSCGAVPAKWPGRCHDCGEWNTLAEESAPPPSPRECAPARRGRSSSPGSRRRGRTGASLHRDRRARSRAQRQTVAGSAVLIGGDPGIGKSTLVLQAAAALARSGAEAPYVSGEESRADPHAGRAAGGGRRAGPGDLGDLVRDVLGTFDQVHAPQLLVIDSIQTVYVGSVAAVAGSMGQVRAARAADRLREAKRRGSVPGRPRHRGRTDRRPAGTRARGRRGPLFRGRPRPQFRMLRAVKNRFGSANEIGVFEMAERGLIEVPNPSELFLAERQAGVAGAVVVAAMEGSRPLLCRGSGPGRAEPLRHPAAHRGRLGWRPPGHVASRAGDPGALGDQQTLHLSERRRRAAHRRACGGSRGCRTPWYRRCWIDRRRRPPCFSARSASPSEVRAVGRTEARLKEAAKLGFEQVFLPTGGSPGARRALAQDGLRIQEIEQLAGAPRAARLR